MAESADSQSHWEIIQIQSSDVNDDIEKLVSTKIESSRLLKNHPKKAELLERVVANSDGMMLWAELMIRELEAGHWSVGRVLNKPPLGLSAMYSMIVDRIARLHTATDRMQSILEHVVAAGRPLRLEELALSIAVVESFQQHGDYDQRGNAAADGRDLVHECSPLLTIMPDGTVQVIHSAFKNYLLEPDALSNPASFSFRENEIHNHLVSILITYMSFDCFNAELIQQTQPKNYLIEYTSRWLVHHCIRKTYSAHIEK